MSGSLLAYLHTSFLLLASTRIAGVHALATRFLQAFFLLVDVFFVPMIRYRF
jgi:hypothetical protein